MNRRVIDTHDASLNNVAVPNGRLTRRDAGGSVFDVDSLEMTLT